MTRRVPAAADFAPAADFRSQLSECPVWDERTGNLYFVDITGKSVHRISNGKMTTWKTGDFPTAVALRAEGGAVVAQASGVGFLDFETGAVQKVCMPDPTPGNRLNECKCDPSGRYWAGSMQTNLNPDGSERAMDRHIGALFRLDPDGRVTRHTEPEFGISNTMAWSPDRRRFYFGDTLRNAIFAFDYDDDSGEIRGRRVLLEGYRHGLPDGSCIDHDGCLWNARWGGGRVIRITPDGSVDLEVEVPVTNPTSCAFAGSGRLIVTSARFGLSEPQLRGNALEGAVLVAETGYDGPPDFRFRG